MKLILKVFFLFFVLFIYSCQQEVSFENPLQNTVTANDSLYIDKIVSYDYGDTTIVEYFYDANKKVVQIKYNYRNFELGNMFFSYPGNEIKPDRIIYNSVFPQINGAQSDTLFIGYDINGKRVKDSTRNLFYQNGTVNQYNTNVVNYSYPSGNTIIFQERKWSLLTNSLFHMIKDTLVTDGLDNVLESHPWKSFDGLNFFEEVQCFYSFDTKKSPLFHTSIRNSMAKKPVEGIYAFFLSNKSNPIHVKEEVAGTLLKDAIYTNYYHSNDLPKMSLGLDRVGNDSLKIFYTYKML